MRIEAQPDDGAIRIRNGYDFIRLDHLTFTWAVEAEGEQLADGTWTCRGCSQESTPTSRCRRCLTRHPESRCG